MIVCETPTPNIEMCHRQMAAHAEAEQTKQKKSIDHQLVSCFYYAENIRHMFTTCCSSGTGTAHWMEKQKIMIQFDKGGKAQQPRQF